MNLEYTPEYDNIKAVLAESLKAHGWVSSDQDPKYKLAFEATSWIANKDYDTLVGVRTASVVIEQHGDLLRIKGLYETEGSNVLCTTYVDMPIDADKATIEELGDGWATSSHDVISKTRMVRLKK